MVNTGYKQSLYFADEDTYGSAAVIDQPIGLVQSINPTETNSLIKVRTLGGTRDYSNIVPGKFEVSGNFEYYLQGGAFLRQAFGEDTGSTATVDTGPRYHSGAGSAGRVHVLGSAASPQTDSFPSFTLEFADDESTVGTNNLHRLFTGCRVNSLSISGTVDAPVSVSCDWIAQGVTISTAGASAVSESTSDPYVFYQGAVYATSGTGIAYTDTFVSSTDSLCLVNSFDFSVNNNLEPTWYICGTTGVYQTLRGLKNLLAKGRDYEANLGLHFETKSMYEKFLGATGATQSQGTLNPYTVIIDFVRSGTIGGVKTATDDYMRLVLQSCKFNDINISGAPEDIVTQSIGVFVESAKMFIVDNDASYK